MSGKLINLKVTTIILIAVLFLFFQGCEDNEIFYYPEPNQPYIYGDVDWSPDGKTLAVTWAGLPEVRDAGIYLIEVDSLTSRTIKVDSSISIPFVTSPSFSPSGEWLAFSWGAKIYKMKLNGDSLTLLASHGRHFSCDWSLSDTLIAYDIRINDSAGTWTMNIDGLNEMFRIKSGSHGELTGGDSLIYVESIPPEYIYAHISIMSLPDSTSREVFKYKKGEPFHVLAKPQVNIEHNKIVVSAGNQIHTLDIDGQNMTKLVDELSGEPCWSPDGTKIAFFKADTMGGTLWTMNSDGTNQTEITGW